MPTTIAVRRASIRRSGRRHRLWLLPGAVGHTQVVKLRSRRRGSTSHVRCFRDAAAAWAGCRRHDERKTARWALMAARTLRRAALATPSRAMTGRWMDVNALQQSAIRTSRGTAGRIPKNQARADPQLQTRRTAEGRPRASHDVEILRRSTNGPPKGKFLLYWGVRNRSTRGNPGCST